MDTERFDHFALSEPLLRALSAAGYQQPTPIQQAAIPEVLAGKDLLATAQTGTGKTAAFALPMLHLLHQRQAPHAKPIRALILSPTRELALQIHASLRSYGRYLPLRTVAVLGGVPQGPQIKSLRKNPDILVATPGRLLDLLSQGYVRLNCVEMLVLDEADRMLDMGFVRDVRRIVAKLPTARQTMFFSATLSADIAVLASDMLRQPAMVAVTPAASVSGNIAQKVLFVERGNKGALLADMLQDKAMRRVLVFTRTKYRANRLSQHLSRHGIAADAIHSNKSQNARQQALAAFDRGRITVLVATDIVARGIDVDSISHVINYELPEDPACYVHRIGRTARAGAAGIALSFCDATELPMLRGIETLTKCALTAVEDHPFQSPSIVALRTRRMASSSALGGSAGRRTFRPRSTRAKRSGW